MSTPTNYRKGYYKMAEIINELRIEIAQVKQHNDQLRAMYQRAVIAKMDANNEPVLLALAEEAQKKCAQELDDQSAQENAYTVGTYIHYLKGRNPNGKFTHTSKGVEVVLPSRSNHLSDEGDQWDGPWNVNWKPKNSCL